jgi:hypothetical protein
MRDTNEASPARDETHRDQIDRILRHDLIRGDLEQQKPGVRQIVVEGADDPVAIRGRMHETSLLTRIYVTFGVRIARDVQPVPAPTLAVARVGEHLVDELVDRC